MKLYNFQRSSASTRVRIALALKHIDYTSVPVQLTGARAASEQHAPEYVARNPQRLVPFLEDGDIGIGQTLAILDYLDRRYPEPPLYPKDDAGRARVLSIAAYICSEIQPLPNLRVEQYLANSLGVSEDKRAAWRRHWIETGFVAVEAMLADGKSGRFCHGDAPTAADCCLVPQVSNAERASIDLAPYPRIRAVVDNALELVAFSQTRAEHLAADAAVTRH